MNIKNKLLATLLIFVFIVSISVVVAEDVADADELAIDNADETIAVSEDSDEPLAAEENTEIQDVEEPPTTTVGDESNLTSIAINVEVLDKNIKVGDKVKVKVTVINWGDYPANDVVAGFSFVDLQENLDSSFKFIDDGRYAVSQADGGYEVDFGFLGAGDTKSVVLTFLATEEGTKYIVALVTSDNSIQEPDSQFNTTITVSANSTSNAKASTSKTLHATGNPLALLALSLFCIVPYYRRK